jgi:hypothetical protein
MRAHVGDWLIIPPAPHEKRERRGQIVELPHPDGSPPYRVRWIEDDHLSLVFPPPDAHLRCPETSDGHPHATTARASAPTTG